MSADSASSSRQRPTLTIVGVGLIGGSIAAAAKKRHTAARVIGVGRSAPRLQSAQAAGIIDEASTDIAAAAAVSDVMIFCTPVDKIVAGIEEAAPHCRPGTLITDAGSIKAAICDGIDGRLPAGVNFVGSHPLAGSEKQGFEHADADLYDGRVCVVTPHANGDRAAADRIAEFWRALGSTVIEMSPETHDEILAETSHVPHLIAAALAGTLREQNRDFAASGFRDTTRIAAGDEHLWSAIFQGNKSALLAGLDRFESQIAQLRQAIEADDREALAALLAAAREIRERLS